MPVRRTSGHFCPVYMGPRKAGSREPARREVAARLWHQPQPRAPGQLPWPPVKASKGCAKQAGGPGWAGRPETEMTEQKEALVGWFGGSRRRDREREGRPQREGPGPGLGAGSPGQPAGGPRCGLCTRRHLRLGKATLWQVALGSIGQPLVSARNAKAWVRRLCVSEHSPLHFCTRPSWTQ